MGGSIDDIFAAGTDVAHYRESLIVHADRFDEVYNRLEFVGKAEASSAPLGSSRLLVLAEAFCIDAVLNIPLIARLAEASAGSVVRIVSRDAHPVLAKSFPGREGQSRIPTVIFLDAEGGAVGHWSERSQCDHQWMAKFLATDPIPPITLDAGRPTAILAEWMTRRFDAQLPFFLSESWRCTRNELAALAARHPAAVDKRAGASLPAV